MQDAKGKDVDLSVYRGKVLLIVNVASEWYPHIFHFSHLLLFSSFERKKREKKNLFIHCCFSLISSSGLTDENYPELTKLYQQYKDQGLHFELILFFHAYHFENP